MKKALIIVATVTAYSIFETALLLSLLLPHMEYGPSSYQLIAFWAQVVLIPGLAALMSGIIYGRHQLPRRTLTILGSGILAVPVALISFAVPFFLLAWSFSVSRVFFGLLLPLVLCALACGMFFLVRKSGAWGVKAETERWLSERRSGISKHERRWRLRGIRFAVCIPATLLLLFFLFLPESLGVLSQLFHHQVGRLSGYQVKIPATWIVQYEYYDPSDERSGIGGLAGRGIARGGNPLPYDSLSAWDVATYPIHGPDASVFDQWVPSDSEVIARHIVTIGNETLLCLDYRASYSYGRTASKADQLHT